MTQITKLRVLLADDHAVVREGLKTLINAQPDMEVIGEAADGEDACRQAQALGPDLLIMDVSMPRLNGIEAAARLRRLCPTVRTVMLSVHEDGGYPRRAREAGAAGYVLKRAAAQELIGAIRAVAGGAIYYRTMESVEGVVPLAGNAAGTDVLSERETAVVRLIAEGHSNKEIAARLDVSVKSVETYKARSLQKLGLESRADIVRYALARGWLENA